MAFFKTHWFGIFLSSVLAGIVAAFIYDHWSNRSFLAMFQGNARPEVSSPLSPSDKPRESDLNKRTEPTASFGAASDHHESPQDAQFTPPPSNASQPRADSREWSLERSFRIPRPAPPLAISPDGTRLAIGPGPKKWPYNPDYTKVEIWDLARGSEVCTLVAHGKVVNGLGFSPDGKMLASAGDVLTLWDAASGREVRTLNLDSRASDVTFNAAGTVLAVAADENAHLVDVKTGRRVWSASGLHHPYLTSIAFEENNRLFGFAGTMLSNVYVIDVATGARVFRTPADAFVVAFSSDGRWVAWGGNHGFIELRELSTRQLVAKWQTGELNVNALAFAPSGKWIISSNERYDNVNIWNLPSGTRRGSIRIGQEAKTVKLSADGKTLAVSGEHEVQVWVAK